MTNRTYEIEQEIHLPIILKILRVEIELDLFTYEEVAMERKMLFIDV